jgi:predicted lipid-binding transport protein (Tim44 family)
MLMSDAIFQHFAADIDARDALPTRTENTLVSVTPQAITSASFTKSLAQLSVHFASEQVSLVRDARGDIIEGDPSHLHHVEDQWVFERDVSSKNPNWKIIET